MKYTMESYTIYSETEGKIKPIAIVLFDEDEEGQFIVTACNNYDRLTDAVDELLEVANLRGDNVLPHPHPADDIMLWTGRMQEAWDELEAIRNAEGKPL